MKPLKNLISVIMVLIVQIVGIGSLSADIFTGHSSEYVQVNNRTDKIVSFRIVGGKGCYSYSNIELQPWQVWQTDYSTDGCGNDFHIDLDKTWPGNNQWMNQAPRNKDYGQRYDHDYRNDEQYNVSTGLPATEMPLNRGHYFYFLPSPNNDGTPNKDGVPKLYVLSRKKYGEVATPGGVTKGVVVDQNNGGILIDVGLHSVINWWGNYPAYPVPMN